MNIPAVLSLFKVIREPSLILPHHTIPTFDKLPVPVSRAFRNYQQSEKEVDIRAIVLDKDNCFAAPHDNTIYPPYSVGHLPPVGSSIFTHSETYRTNSKPL